MGDDDTKTRRGNYDLGNGWFAAQRATGRWFGFQTFSGDDDGTTRITRSTIDHLTLSDVRSTISRLVES